MAKAGWCEGCGAYQWVAEDGRCVRGHEASMVSGIYETEPDRGVLQETLESVGTAAERAGEVARAAWTEAEPSLKEAGKSAGKAAVEFAEGMKRFGKTVLGQEASGTNADPPPPPPAEPAVTAEPPAEPQDAQGTSQEEE